MKIRFFPTIIGAIICVFIFTIDYFQFSLIEKFLVFAIFVILPLIILLIENKDQTALQKKIYSFIKVIHFPAAILSLASLMSNKTWEVGTSVISGSLSLAWLLFTFLLALYGVLLIIVKKEKIEEIAIGAGLIYFFIGGIWFTLYQFQLTFLQVDPTVSALSSVHFHFSSAIVPIFIGMLGRILVIKSWYHWLVIVDIIGPILIAIGIVVSKPLEMIGVSIFAFNIFIYCTYLLLKMRKNMERNYGNLFLTLSSIAFYSIIVISICYPIAKLFFSITIMDMIPIYGTLHAFGFVLFGLLGWILVRNSPHIRKRQIVHT